MKDTKLTPRITETAKGLWGVYGLFTIACVLAMRWAGMSWLDAVMHAFTTMSTGGFSPYDASFAHWNSPAIEAVTIVFMLIAGINFATHFQVLRKRSLKSYREDPEVGVFFAVIAVSVVGITLFLLVKGVYRDFWVALRYTAFNLVSVATSTGYANTNFGVWPLFAPLWMLFLVSFVSCSGSTGGGIKLVRAVLMFKQAFRELARIVHPRAYIPVKLGGHPIENNIIFAVLAFMLVYGGTISVMTMLLAATGSGLRHRVLRRGGLHQQPRPRSGAGRPCDELRRAGRFPDLAVLGGDVARPARTAYGAGTVYARVLAQVSRTPVHIVTGAPDATRALIERFSLRGPAGRRSLRLAVPAALAASRPRSRSRACCARPNPVACCSS